MLVYQRVIVISLSQVLPFVIQAHRDLGHAPLRSLVWSPKPWCRRNGEKRWTVKPMEKKGFHHEKQ